ncbi:hypothetical protein TNCV_948731 [Trichonephila clavipes]|nr:hypothetical protein TNCV_948731 [Trichonephila clavipes]
MHSSGSLTLGKDNRKLFPSVLRDMEVQEESDKIAAQLLQFIHYSDNENLVKERLSLEQAYISKDSKYSEIRLTWKRFRLHIG